MPDYGSLREKIAAETAARKSRYAEFERLYAAADAAGKAAVTGATVTPMVVSERANPLDDSSAVKQAWIVEGGPCGFAWITISPATCSFARWLKKSGIGRTAYGGGWQIWVKDYGQSVQRKEAYANAFATVIRAAGLTAYADSRLD